MEFLFSRGRRTLNTRALCISCCYHLYSLLHSGWSIKTLVPCLWQLLLTQYFRDLGLLDRYFKLNILKYSVEMRKKSLGQWLAHLHPLQEHSLHWEVDERSSRMPLSFGEEVEFLCRGLHFGGHVSFFGNICGILSTDEE